MKTAKFKISNHLVQWELKKKEVFHYCFMKIIVLLLSDEYQFHQKTLILCPTPVASSFLWNILFSWNVEFDTHIRNAGNDVSANFCQLVRQAPLVCSGHRGDNAREIGLPIFFSCSYGRPSRMNIAIICTRGIACITSSQNFINISKIYKFVLKTMNQKKCQN